MASIYNTLYSPPAPNRPSNIPHDIRFWKIEMAIGNGYYILWDGTFVTKKKAQESIPASLASSCRAAEYQRGHGTDGPERVNP